MKATDLRTPVTIQSRDTGMDAAGQPVTTWTDIASVYSDVRGATGLSTIRGQYDGVQAEVNAYSFRIRYREGLDAGMRVLLNGQPFDVQQVRMDHARRQWTDLVCAVGGNDG